MTRDSGLLTVEARLSTVDGKGVGRWRVYFARDLVPKCQVRVKRGREVVFGPCRAEELQALRKDAESTSASAF